MDKNLRKEPLTGRNIFWISAKIIFGSIGVAFFILGGFFVLVILGG